MSFLEKDLEAIIFEATQTEEGRAILIEKGLTLKVAPFFKYFKSRRQLNLNSYGICDMITMSRQDSFVPKTRLLLNQPIFHIEIIEIKKDEVDIDTMIQVCRYARGVERYLNTFHPSIKFRIFTTMIGRTVKKSDWLFLSERDQNSRIITYKYEIDGVRFTEEDGFFKPSENWGRKRLR